jgi:prepilin-type N-terminal cleavage/methylation domain-containing protein/prepilin-type processing-associated H-X9-DG protein
MKSDFSGRLPQKSLPPGLRNGLIRPTAQAGFTLIEILVAVMIMALLTVLILSGVQNVRQRAKIQFCQNNLRELGMAFDMYDTFWEGKLPPSTGPDDDDLRALYPLCAKSFELFICIDTANWIDTADHLANNAGSRTSGPGHSYEYLSYYLYASRGDLLPTPIPKTRSNVDVRADKCWLLMDSMESGIPNKPDMTDNHYENGGNVLFADSHVEWIEHGKWDVDFQHGNAK